MAMGQPQPGAKTFLSFLVLICVLVLVSVFLDRVENLEKKIERVAVSKQVNEINSLLVVTMLEHRINNKLDELAGYHHGNPFEFLVKRIQGLNYVENPRAGQESVKGFWYYDASTGETIYRSGFDASQYRYRLEFEYSDLNRSGSFDKGIDDPQLLSLQAVQAYPRQD
jgi:hypothetical protein